MRKPLNQKNTKMRKSIDAPNENMVFEVRRAPNWSQNGSKIETETEHRKNIKNIDLGSILGAFWDQTGSKK